MNNWIELSEQALAANFHALRAAAGAGAGAGAAPDREPEVLAVVKSNGYGHGALACGLALVRAGARWLGVTCAQEGARLRQALEAEGLAADILVMCGFLPEDAALIRSARLVPVVWTPEQIGWLTTGLPQDRERQRAIVGGSSTAANPQKLRVQVEIDTGMGRQGVRPGVELLALLGQIKQADLALDGLFTHFCSSEVAGAALTIDQRTRFAAAVLEAAAAGFKPAWIHAENTSAIDNPAGGATQGDWLQQLAAEVGARTMVRPGIGLYGYCLPVEGTGGGDQVCGKLKPVMTWKSRVLSVRELQPGETVGYGATYKASKPMRVALLPVGYADGLRRELSGRSDGSGGWVMIAGRRAPILGRLSMNLTVVDVTDIAEVKAGDEIVILGEGITADDHARLAGTISYEILCGIHPCN